LNCVLSYIPVSEAGNQEVTQIELDGILSDTIIIFI